MSRSRALVRYVEPPPEDVSLAAIVAAALAFREACVATYPGPDERRRVELESRRVLFAAVQERYPNA